MNSYNRLGQRPKLKSALNVALILLGIFGLFRLFHSYRFGAQQPQRKVGKVMAVYGNHPVYERTLATHEEQSRRLGYPLFVFRNPVLDGYWNKLAVLLSVMLQELEKPADQRLEWLFWSDADTIVMNPNIPLEIFLPPPELPDVHLLLSKDWNGMNNGVFPIRVHPWSIHFLTAALSYPIVHPDVHLYWPDQSAMSNLIKDNEYFARSIVYCPLRWFNAYMRSPDGESPNPDSPEMYQVHPGDLLVHFPGTPADHLETTLGPYLGIAEARRAEWRAPLGRTEYVKETEAFWRKRLPPAAVQDV
ncbi:galactosyl transferase GMA12/MNN10 family protein [Aspergillus pseudoustus]|uniref:Galactosyl transferase GMA12/MNN10 family protein n=1 Tax=Aspergillus pseudoustus TaxID=1810923 RepID=A0ABR4IPZ1_9EURO